MTSDRKDFITDSPEAPPPYSGDVKLWAEDMDNYLRRRFQALDEKIKNLEAAAAIRLNSGSN